MKKEKSMKASSLRSVLAVLLVLMILAAGGGFYYGLQQIRALSVEVNHAATDANASASAVEELQRLKQALTQSETLVAKANQLFATQDNYQSQALKDVQKYAATTGVTIANTSFDPEVPSGDATTPTVSSDKTFTITLQSPVSYKKLLQFLEAIEGNLPKLQITSIELSHPATNDADKVNTGDIKIVISTS